MFARSLINRSVAPVLAAILAIAVMPDIASAQERPEREFRGGAARLDRQGPPTAQPQQQMPQPMQRIEVPRSVEAPRQVYQAQGYQQQPRGDMPQRAPGWDNRQQWGGDDRGRNWQSERVQAQAQPLPQPQAQTGSPDRGRDQGQWGNRDRERGDSQTGRPTWQARNPAYTDANRNPAYRPQTAIPQVQPNQQYQQNRGANVARGDDRGANWNRGEQNRWGRGDRDGWQNPGQNRWGRNDQNGWQGQRNDWDRNRSWNGNRGGYNGNRYAYGNNGNYRHWDNDWRRDRRYDWYNYRNSNRNFFRGGYYSAPYRNYSYSQLSIGIVLGSLFYDQRYWINNPSDYRLPAAYGPYRWVRYYDDAILVDVYTGEVVDVINDFYW